MVLLEIATLIMGGVGLADYYCTKIYNENLYDLKKKYGEHPNIDDIFEDICTLGGEYFQMPELDLKSDNPGIKMGSFYSDEPLEGDYGPTLILKQEFYTTFEDRVYFAKKYRKEVERQAKLRNKALERMYNQVLPLYKRGEFKSIGSTPQTSRIYKTPIMIARDGEHYKYTLNRAYNTTILKELFEPNPNIYTNHAYHFYAEFFIKENTFNQITTKEAYDILFECCYYHLKDKCW